MITEIVNFQNGRLQSPIAPTYKCSIFGSYIHNLDLEALSLLILEKEKEITSLDLPPNKISHGYTGLGPKSLTSRFKVFNALSWDHPEIRKLRQEIRYIYNLSCDYFNIDKNEKVYAQCWANVLRKGEKMNNHRHVVNTDQCFLSGHFTVKCKNTQTIYENPYSDILHDPEYYYFNNQPGRISIFNSQIYHYTTEHNDDSERITMAFDLIYKVKPDESKNITIEL